MPKINFYGALAKREKSGFFKAFGPTSISADQIVKNDAGRHFRGVAIELIVTNAAALSLTPQVHAYDDAGNLVDHLWDATVAITANGTYVYVFMEQGGAPGLNGAGITEKKDIPFPRGWELHLIRGAGSCTIEVHMAYL